MAEKVIFEFRVKQDGERCGFEVRHGGKHFTTLGRDFSARCRQGSGASGVHHHGGRTVSELNQDEARRRTRETLDFLEQMYDDLFSEEERQD